MTRPVLIFTDPSTLTLKVAGLLLLDRLVVAAHRAAGGSVTVVARGEIPDLPRARALGVPVRTVAEAPPVEGPTLVMAARALAQVPDLVRVLEVEGRLVRSDERPLPIGVVREGFEELEPALGKAPPVLAKEVAEVVDCPAAARQAGRRFWASLTSRSDGLVDRYFNRPVGRPFSKLLVGRPVSPNAVSVLATVLGAGSGGLLALGRPDLAVWGAMLLQVSAIVDCIDGDLARAAFKESGLGRWLDLVGDQVVHVAVFGGVAVGLWRSGSDLPVVGLGISAVVGVLISFLVVLRGLLRPALLRRTGLQRLIDATTNRDFSVLLLALAVLGRLEWFLWLAAVGVHLFWMTALVLQLKGSARGPVDDEERV